MTLLKDFRDRDYAYGRIVALRPGTTGEAYTAWLSDRRRRLVDGIQQVNSLDARSRGRRVTALNLLATKLGEWTGEKVTVERDLVLKRKAAKGEGAEHYDADLGALVLPGKIGDAILADLHVLFCDSEDGILRGDEKLEEFQAINAEVQLLLMFLQNCKNAAPVGAAVKVAEVVDGRRKRRYAGIRESA